MSVAFPFVEEDIFVADMLHVIVYVGLAVMLLWVQFGLYWYGFEKFRGEHVAR